MKAIQFKKYGGPDVLELVQTETPQIKNDEVLIEVKAIGVNYADTARREGQYVVPTNLPFIPGAEVAGIVSEVGADVQGIQKGMRVVTLIENGGYAEYAVAPAANLIPIPEGDRKSTRLNSSHVAISYAVFCLKKKKNGEENNFWEEYIRTNYRTESKIHLKTLQRIDIKDILKRKENRKTNKKQYNNIYAED